MWLEEFFLLIFGGFCSFWWLHCFFGGCTGVDIELGSCRQSPITLVSSGSNHKPPEGTKICSHVNKPKNQDEYVQ